VFSSLPFSKVTPQTLVRQLKDLPPTPKVLHKLQSVILSPASSLEDIAQLIALEPGLSARVVRMANSTKFGGGSHVSNIIEAIQRVGLQGVREVVTYAIASQLVGQPLLSYGLDANTLWFRAVACALAASSLAQNNGIDEGDAYTAGLMHGLGLVVLDRYSNQTKGYKFASSGYPLDFAPDERGFVGFDHAEAGAALLEYWKFTDAICEAVRYQMAPEKSVQHRKLSMTIATARWARSLLCVPEEKIPELPPQHWLDEAGIGIADFGDWLREVSIGYNLAKVELRLS
jgi:HD-like signal output (HDOD) protein